MGNHRVVAAAPSQKRCVTRPARNDGRMDRNAGSGVPLRLSGSVRLATTVFLTAETFDRLASCQWVDPVAASGDVSCAGAAISLIWINPERCVAVNVRGATDRRGVSPARAWNSWRLNCSRIRPRRTPNYVLPPWPCRRLSVRIECLHLTGAYRVICVQRAFCGRKDESRYCGSCPVRRCGSGRCARRTLTRRAARADPRVKMPEGKPWSALRGPSPRAGEVKRVGVC